MAVIKCRRETKSFYTVFNVYINGEINVAGQTGLLERVFPGIKVTSGGLLEACLGAKYRDCHRAFDFKHKLNISKDSMPELERQLIIRFGKIKEWVEHVPVVEEFIIEI